MITQTYTCVKTHRTLHPQKPIVPYDNLKNICTDRTDVLLGQRWGNSAIRNDRLVLVTKESCFFKAFAQHTQPLCPSDGLHKHCLPLGTPIHHMQCEWYPEIFPAGCASPFLPPRLPPADSKSNILGWLCKTLATSQTCLSATPFLSHTPASSSPQIHRACAVSSLCPSSSPPAFCSLGSQLRCLPLREAFPEPSIYRCSNPSSLCISEVVVFLFIKLFMITCLSFHRSERMRVPQAGDCLAHCHVHLA